MAAKRPGPGPNIPGNKGFSGQQGRFRPFHGQPRQKPERGSDSAGFWLYGIHAAKAALANPMRKVRRAVVTERMATEFRAASQWVELEVLAPDAMSRLLPSGAVHQGVALLCEPLPALDLEEAVARAPAGKRLVAVLDQITDPHNEGAILRSAAAFGVSAVVVQDRHAPPESGVLAKAASGALDIVPRIAVVNISRALEQLGRLGFWRVALSSDGDEQLRDLNPTGDVAIVLGAEGSGLRRLVREHCDVSASIPVLPQIGSLNVSNAAAIAFYELRRTA